MEIKFKNYTYTPKGKFFYRGRVSMYGAFIITYYVPTGRQFTLRNPKTPNIQIWNKEMTVDKRFTMVTLAFLPEHLAETKRSLEETILRVFMAHVHVIS